MGLTARGEDASSQAKTREKESSRDESDRWYGAESGVARLGQRLLRHRGWQEHRIDDVDDPVARRDIGLRHRGVIDLDRASGRAHGQTLTLHRLGAPQGSYFSRGDPARHDVIDQHGAKAFPIGEERVQRPGREFGERGVSGREDGIGAGSFQRLDQSGRLERAGQGAEFAGADRGLDEIRRSGLRSNRLRWAGEADQAAGHENEGEEAGPTGEGKRG